MDRRRFIATVGTVSLVGGAGCNSGEQSGDDDQEREDDQSGDDDQEREDDQSGDDDQEREDDGDSQNEEESPDGRDDQGDRDQQDERTDLAFKVGDDGFEQYRDSGYEQFDVRGVNIGMGKPGRFPGEAAITRAEYDRWLSAIGEIANAVRIYTIHPPEFYRALAAHNESASSPLYLLQGTWVPVLDLVEAGDATTQAASVDREIERTVDVVHGETTLPERPGHASGTYDADVSDTLLGYLFGVEWPPEVVVETNENGASGEFYGTYLQTAGGSPFERWLARRLETFASHGREEYGTQRPLSFVNWVTTDPLDHPYEPFEVEDKVSVDPDSIESTDAFTAGTFATYHIYPYYPDSLNENPEYVNYIDHRGEPNNYAGYLDDIVTSTDHPILVGEFGVPSSRGVAHHNVHGRHQGRHSEREQGEMVAAMFEDIAHADTAGGLVFSWQDEWFKRTWNLAARSVPGRRPHWSNIETPEQGFGLLSFDPVDSVSLDGSAGDWTGAKTVEPSAVADSPPERTLTELRVTHDVEGLYFRLSFEALPDPVDWTRTNALVTIGLTGRSTSLPLGTGAEARADFVVVLAGPDDSRLLVDARYDAFARQYGQIAGLPLDSYRDGTAGFVPVREPITLGYTVPATDERVPLETVETGTLEYGTGNPESDSYSSLTDVHVDTSGNVVEGRLPWILLNVADPSGKRRIATDWEDGLDTVAFDSVSLGAATFVPDGDGTGQARSTGGVTNLSHHVPGRDGTTLRSVEYAWEPWNRPEYEMRLKESYSVLENSLD